MVQIRVISDEDWNVLKRLYEANRNLLQAAPTRPSANSQYLDGDDSMSPEVYIAVPPDGGIPALTPMASGSSSDQPPTEGDIPGSALCNVYKISNGALVPVVGLSKRVYNLSESAITGDDWLEIKRDKFGSWLTSVSGSGVSSQVIMFEINEIIRGIGLNCNAVYVTVINIGCGTTSAAIGDIVEVWDGLRCRFNLPEDELIGLRGYATLMMNPGEYEDGVVPGPVASGSCRWEVIDLCCSEEF